MGQDARVELERVPREHVVDEPAAVEAERPEPPQHDGQRRQERRQPTQKRRNRQRGRIWRQALLQRTKDLQRPKCDKLENDSVEI